MAFSKADRFSITFALVVALEFIQSYNWLPKLLTLDFADDLVSRITNDHDSSIKPCSVDSRDNSGVCMWNMYSPFRPTHIEVRCKV